MANKLSSVVSVLFLSVILILSCFATEKVAKNNRTLIYPNSQDQGTYITLWGNINYDQLGDQNSFVVYTAPETDSLIQSLKDRIKQNEDQITILRTNNRALADANDAITKRLNDLELRVGKGEQK